MLKTQPNHDKQIALSTIQQIKMHLQEQRRNNPLRNQPILSPQEQMTCQVLADATRLVKAVKTLSDALVALQEESDPFAPAYERAEQAIQEAQLAVDYAVANWARLPARLRRGVKHVLDDNTDDDA